MLVYLFLRTGAFFQNVMIFIIIKEPYIHILQKYPHIVVATNAFCFRFLLVLLYHFYY